MIIREIIKHNGREFRKTYTNSELTMLRQVGTNKCYISAIDLVDSSNEYEEIERPKKETKNTDNKKISPSTSNDVGLIKK